MQRGQANVLQVPGRVLGWTAILRCLSFNEFMPVLSMRPFVVGEITHLTYNTFAEYTFFEVIDSDIFSC